MNEAQDSIQKGSKSFYLASLFFPADVQNDCWLLYQWCRHCDDQIDRAESPAAAREVLMNLRNETRLAIETALPVSAPFEALRTVVFRHRIPAHLPGELLDGFAMDVDHFVFETMGNLEKYAYHVAGVVGLMMSYIMRVDVGRAGSFAVAMGNAMQLTNISRDVLEDYRLNRVYLPRELLRQEGLDPAEMWNRRDAVFRVVSQLLDRADALYAEGRQGLRFIPWRSRWAVSIASHIYQYIGVKIRRQGPGALMTRTYVTFPEKLRLAFKGVWA